MKCTYLGCNKEATVKIVRASVCVCDEHLKVNESKFGCSLTTEKLDKNGQQEGRGMNEQDKRLFSTANIIEEDLICPFCGETEFDKIGLKMHLIKWCNHFQELKLPPRVIDLSGPIHGQQEGGSDAAEI